MRREAGPAVRQHPMQKTSPGKFHVMPNNLPVLLLAKKEIVSET